MNYQRLKKYAFALALTVGFVVAPGLSSLSAVQAQWPYNQDRWERERERERQRREEWRRRQMESRRNRDWDGDGRIDRGGYWGNRRNNDGYYGNNRGYGYDNGQVQKGYRDGLDRGQKDAKTNRVPTPNNSQHYREGNPSYREGFARGYQVGYRQYARGRYNGW